ncbi:hypothetical protein RNJ44_03869 [Nakaseomyces bracarensis]|uniref:NADP-dependent oxidoreductase domain-containing protein n=1 Tax=Nakaseomyces bracarensis TaxID=273131 RepID=A0ABR4NYE0_9SACH
MGHSPKSRAKLYWYPHKKPKGSIIMSKVKEIKTELEKIGTGYGLTSLTTRTYKVEKSNAFASLKKAIELAKESGHKAYFNAGEFYGPNYANLKLLKDFFNEYPNLRSDVLISCKGALDNSTLAAKGKYDDVVASVKVCLKEIGGYIDIFEPARIDMSICKPGQVYPEETFEAITPFVDSGEIGSISLSEVNADQINAIVRDYSDYLVCVEVELSLFCDDILKDGVAKACSDHNLAIICYSPLGRGMLTGQWNTNADIPDEDFRKKLRIFQDDALQNNRKLVEFVQSEIVSKRPAEKQITMAQVALAWIRKWSHSAMYPNSRFIPIPSGSTAARVAENFDESKSVISVDEFTKINNFVDTFVPSGGRYEFI